LADNPDDKNAYLMLGTAYYKLFWETKERERSFDLGYLHPILIRHTQLVTALNQALKIDPDLEVAHELLATHYASCRQLNLPNYYHDVELKHRQEQLRIRKARVEKFKGSEEEVERQQKFIKQLEEEVKSLKHTVDTRTNLYEINAANKPVVQRAVEALKQGLGAEAQSILEKADPKDLVARSSPNSPPLGYLLRIRLLLSLGRVADVREAAFTEDNKKMNWGTAPEVGLPAYAWFELLAAAAIGEYAEADKVLAGLEKQVHERNATEFPVFARSFVAAMLHFQSEGFGWRKSDGMDQWRQAAMQYLEQECETKTLRGWLALEAGNIDLARKEFRETLELARINPPDDAAGAAIGVSMPPARAQHLPLQAQILQMHSVPLAATRLRWIESAAR
jgi:cell division septum initiation protein DivIVA